MVFRSTWPSFSLIHSGRWPRWKHEWGSHLWMQQGPKTPEDLVSTCIFNSKWNRHAQADSDTIFCNYQTALTFLLSNQSSTGKIACNSSCNLWYRAAVTCLNFQRTIFAQFVPIMFSHFFDARKWRNQIRKSWSRSLASLPLLPSQFSYYFFGLFEITQVSACLLRLQFKEKLRSYTHMGLISLELETSNNWSLGINLESSEFILSSQPW
jgi:hypothetical protein